MHTIAIKKKVYTAPASFNELTAKQLLQWCACIANGLTGLAASKRIGYYFSGVPAWTYFSLPAATRYQIGDLFDFLFGKNTLTVMKINSFRVGLGKYYGPGDRMKNVIAEEFIMADAHFVQYEKTKDIKYLDMLLANIYRERKKDKAYTGDDRCAYNSFEVLAREKKIRRLSLKMKHALLLQYQGVRNLLPAKFPNVFNAKNRVSGKNFGWPGIITDLAGPKLGTDKDVLKMNVWNLFFVMEMNEVRRLEAEKKT